MQRLLSDIAYYDGRLPASLELARCCPGQPPPTFILAQNTSSGWPWPGGGARVEYNWRQGQCGALQAGGLRPVNTGGVTRFNTLFRMS